MAQFARPSSDITATSFTGVGVTTTGNLYQNVDEVTAVDTDYNYGANGTTSTYETLLTSVSDPVSSTGHVISYRLARTNSGTLNSSGNAVTVTVDLYQGTTLIASAGAISVSGTWVTGTYTLTSTETDSISNYADLRIRCTTSSNTGNASNKRSGGVSWLELSVPDAPPPGNGSSLLTGLVSYWNLDETSGNASDSVGGNTGTSNSITYNTTGKIGKCFSFDGSTSYVDCGNPSNLSLTSNGSFSAWFNVPALEAGRVILSKGNSGADLNGYTLDFETPTGQTDVYLKIEIASDVTAISMYYDIQTVVSINTWYHVVITFDGTTVYMYLNNSMVNSMSQTNNNVSTLYPFRIGARGDNNSSNLWHGLLDEIGVWNRALTTTEITTLYNSGNGMTYPFGTGGTTPTIKNFALLGVG